MALAPTEHFVPCQTRCHIGAADDSALCQRTRPNVPGYLNFLLVPCRVSIDLRQQNFTALTTVEFLYTHIHARTFPTV
jgi:hypothetical protein